MNACISESGCVCELILPGSVSLLVVKLWDLVIKKYAWTFQFLSYFTDKSQNSVDNTFLRWMILCTWSARDVLYALLSVACSMCLRYSAAAH